MNRPNVLTPGEGALIEAKAKADEAARPHARERRSRALVVAGWIIALVGVVLYCVASFAAETDADLAAILFHGAVPAARAALVVIGGGTLLWIVGTIAHINAVLDGAPGDPDVTADEGDGRRRG